MYRYGFNGQEKSDEINGEGNSYTAEFWQYDARIGRRWNLDPKPYAGISDYATFGDNPILNVDPDGDLFFGAFGSSSDQRKAARTFQKEHGGNIKNYWRKDISVKYQDVTKGFDGVFSVNSRVQRFKGDGSFVNPNGEIREHVPGAMEKWSQSENLIGKATYDIADGFYVTGQNLFTKHFSASGRASHLGGGLTNNNENVSAFVTAGATLVPVGAVEGTMAKTAANLLKPLGLGSTGRSVAANLTEQLAMKEIMSNPTLGKVVMTGMKDSRWFGWSKMQYTHTALDGTKTTIHYVGKLVDGVLKAVDDFKFK